MWIYNQTTGKLTDPRGAVVGVGYSGHGVGLDNPSYEQVKDTGPIPAGLWLISPPVNSPHLGPCSFELSPKPGTKTFGRSGFFIHGDDVHHPGQEVASLGCIVLPPDVRKAIFKSKDQVLKVVNA